MKVCIVGAGSIGGLMGVRLSCAGEEVTLIARGMHLRAIERGGLKLLMNDGAELVTRDAKATADMRSVGEQDLVVLGLKAHQIEPVVDDICSMIGPNTTVLTTQNGIPWWYFQRLGGEFDGNVVRTMDPNGKLFASIDPARILGCIAYPAAEIVEPGVIKHIEGMRFPVGELDNSLSERATTVSEMLQRAGFKAPVLEDIRSEIWLKAWGNLTFNPISALTQATLVDICQFPLTRQLAVGMMSEAQAIGERLGARFRVTLEKRIAGAEGVGAHKTSMLQDLEAGKSMEIDALVGAIVELGALTGIPTPHISAVHACVKLLDKTVQDAGGWLRIERG